MKPTVTYPDVERAVRDALATAIAPYEPTVTVGVGVPSDWTIMSAPHLQVALDGTPGMAHPVYAYSTVRVVAWAASPTEAKALAWLAHGLLLAQRVLAIAPLTGLLPARDTETRAELASFTVRVSTRSVSVTV